MANQRRSASAASALLAGILFSFLFTGLIWWAGGRLAGVEHLPDLGASWYYWKLPVPTFWSRATAWGLYLAHQVTLWGLIWWAQKSRPKYGDRLHPANWWALGANALFILLHFAQSHLFYDGLAQDVSIWSSQVSVSILLIFVLMMENPRRGVFFGAKAPIRDEVVRLTRTYHGYYFAWAIVYTFWYHPMENTPGHLFGFLYMFLLLLQGSLFFTRVHLNRWWTLTQEVLVLAHGAVVALQQGSGIWPMFAFGFAGIFIISQMHGLGWSRWTKGAVLGLYLAGVALTYSLVRGWGHLPEITYIPVIDYAGVFLLAGLITLGIRLGAAWRRSRAARWALSLLGALSLAVVGFVIWAESTNNPMREAIAALAPDQQVQVEPGRWLVFKPAGRAPAAGLVFYPGGRVDPIAYAPLAHAVAEQGYLVVIPPMPLNLAVLSINKADAVIAAYPEVKTWAIGGHSLGGSMAAHYAKTHPDAVRGLLLLASYPAASDDLSGQPIAVASVSGSRDGLATPAKIAASRALLPSATTWHAIAGGNHAQFGWYGDQRGDNPAEIGRVEQTNRTVTATVMLLLRMEGLR